jgi:hypothetical protein
MDELLKHLSEDDVVPLYRNEVTGIIEYSELIRLVYIIIKRALLEGADTLEVTETNFIWSRQGEILSKSCHPLQGVNYVAQLRKIIAVDSEVRDHVRANYISDSDVIVDFV